MRKFSIDMLNGPLPGKIILFAIPIIATNILQLLFNVADLAMAGKYCSEFAVSAISFASPLIALVANLFIGLSAGVSAAVGHAIGSKSRRRTHRAVHTSVPAAVVAGFIFSITGCLASAYLLRMMNVPEDIYPTSLLYIRIYFSGAIFSLLYNFGSAILRAAGDTLSPLLYLCVAEVINIFLNLFFTVSLKWGVVGIACSTVFSQATAASFVIANLMRRKDNCKLSLSRIHFYRHQLRRILRVGIPSGIISLILSLSGMFFCSTASVIGTIAHNGYEAAVSIENYLYAGLSAFYHATLNFTAQNAGARQYDRIRKSAIISSLCVLVIGLPCGIFTYFLGPKLLGMHLGYLSDSINYGLVYIKYACVFCFLYALLNIFSAVLCGMDMALISMIIFATGIFMFRIIWVSTVYANPAYHNLDGLFASYPVSWLLSIILHIIAIEIFYNKKKRERH